MIIVPITVVSLSFCWTNVNEVGAPFPSLLTLNTLFITVTKSLFDKLSE